MTGNRSRPAAGSHVDDARCADLVLGLLSHAERRDAIAHATLCEECALRLREHVAAAVRAADAGAARRGPARIARLRPAWIVPSALAAAAAVLALVVLGPHAARRPAGPEPWLLTSADGVLLREGEAEDPHLARGFAAYARHDLAAARRELEQAQGHDTSEQARRLYLAHVLLMQGEPARALALLQSLDWVQIPVAVRREAARIDARALRATGHAAAADSLEKRLSSTPEWIPVLP